MFREIKKKKVVLKSREPFSAEARLALQKSDLEDLILTNMRLEGSDLTREDIASILDGNVKKDITINDHILIRRISHLKMEMESMLEMRTSLSLKTVRRFYALIAGLDEADVSYRTSNYYVEELGCRQPDFQDIGEQMEILEDELLRSGEGGNELYDATLLHCRLIEIFPFAEYNGILARTILYYRLMGLGYPIFALNFSKAEYDRAVAGYLKDDDISVLYGGLERSLYNKMEQILKLTERN